MKYHALFVIFENAAKFENCRLLQSQSLDINQLVHVSQLSGLVIGLFLCSQLQRPLYS